MKDQELIFSYLEGTLRAGERRAFEARLQREPALAAELAKAEKSANALKATFQRDAQKAALMDMMERVDAEKKVRPLYSRWWVAAAATVILLAAAIWLVSRQGEAGAVPTRSALLTESRFFDPQEVASTTMGAGQTDAYAQGYAFFRQGAYAEAVDMLALVEPADKYFAQSRLLLGTALLATQRPDEALPFLLEASQMEETAEYARWYLALTFMAIGDEGQAFSMFEEVANQNRYRRKDAKLILANWPLEE